MKNKNTTKDTRFKISDEDMSKAFSDFRGMFNLNENDPSYISTKDKVEKAISSGKSIDQILQELLKRYKSGMASFKKTAKSFKDQLDKDKEFADNLNDQDVDNKSEDEKQGPK